RRAVGRATRGCVVGKESCGRADDGSAARVTGCGCEGGRCAPRSGARPAAVGGRGLLADGRAVHPGTGSNRNEERRRGALLVGPERGPKYWNLASDTAPGGGRRKSAIRSPLQANAGGVLPRRRSWPAWWVPADCLFPTIS